VLVIVRALVVYGALLLLARLTNGQIRQISGFVGLLIAFVLGAFAVQLIVGRDHSARAALLGLLALSCLRLAKSVLDLRRKALSSIGERRL
jgi:uncharacterized membrane protein YcaP (DUF421 family)